jgi:hypothetical protein
MDRPANDRTADHATRSHIPIDSVSPRDDDDDEPLDDTPPKSIGGYHLIRILGAGGQGSVYEAVHSETGQRVALKLLSTKYAGSPVSVERFRQEGRLASQIAHPRCVFVYGADTDSGVPFIVMELMPGTTLKELIDRRGPLPVGEAIVRILDVIDGLIEAHRLGVIHRDVKPSNCFLTADDRVKIGDFGLSKSLLGSNPGKQLTTSGKFVGTVLFAPPEQIRGDEVGYDSDVYSAAATLYFLLSGQAPHQHESLTAVLAKAISEPPPSLRNKRPEVPKELDRAVLKGLERDRSRRWQSLEEFRDALVELLPSRLTPARPRSLVAAYLLDCMIFGLGVQLPYEFLREYLVPGSGANLGVRVTFDLLILFLSALYFAFFEGSLAWTPGKWLLRLRVVRMGETGPPGLIRASLRSLVFHAIWTGLITGPVLVFSLAGELKPAPAFACVLLGAGLGLGCLIALMNQLRSTLQYRGLHDFASDCQVVQRAFRTERRRMVSPYANPLERTERPAADLPESIGPFDVRGQIASHKDGSLVWLGEDRSLSRRVLVWLKPASSPTPFPPAVIRPTRLRRLGDGCQTWNGTTYEWIAQVAPAGAPIADVADPDRSISWADARPILEQLTDEFRAAEADKSVPETLEIDQVWVEPAGRVLLLDYPVRNVSGVENLETSAPQPIDLIRQTAALALQGRPWEIGEPIKAPLPPHARAIANRLTDHDSDYRDLARLHRDLADSHALPSRVTAAQRGTHVLLQWLFNIFPNVLLWILLMSLLMNGIAALGIGFYAWSFERVEATANMPGQLARIANRDEVREALDPEHREHTMAIIAERAKRAREFRERTLKETLTPPERSAVNYVLRLIRDADTIQKGDKDDLAGLTQAVRRAHDTTIDADGTPRYRHTGNGGSQPDPLFITIENLPYRDEIAAVIVFLAGMFLTIGFLVAVAFRGGVSWLLTGLALVHEDGRPCGRLWCGLRAILVWLPIIGLCALLVWIQTFAPSWVITRVLLSIGLIGVVIAYPVIAIRQLGRPPQDRLMGTRIVPM